MNNILLAQCMYVAEEICSPQDQNMQLTTSGGGVGVLHAVYTGLLLRRHVNIADILQQQASPLKHHPC